jgi:hypothetical protein
MDAAALREFCHRERPPSVVLDNMFDASQPPAADALELDIGQEMTRSFGRVLDCEAILSTGVVTVYFAESDAAQRCAAALNGGNFDGRRIGARYCAGGASRASANGTTDEAAAPTPEAADAASVGDATPPEAELGDTTGDEGESGDDGSCGSLAASLSDDDDESDAGDVVSSLREHMLKATAPPPPPAGRGRGRTMPAWLAAQRPKADEDAESAWTAGPAAQKRFAAAAEVAAKAQADRLGERVGGWEIHEKGVASKLMAKMGYVRGSGLGKNSQGRTDILPIPAPRRGTRDCENPGLGAPEAAPVEAPKATAGRAAKRSRAAYDRDSGRAAPRSVFDAVAATTRRAVAPDPKKLKEAARRKTQRDVHRSAGALRAADTAGAEALKELEKRLAALERAKARQAAHGADAVFAAKRDREIADVRNRIGALTARHAHLRNACATRRDRDRKEKHVF